MLWGGLAIDKGYVAPPVFHVGVVPLAKPWFFIHEVVGCVYVFCQCKRVTWDRLGVAGVVVGGCHGPFGVHKGVCVSANSCAAGCGCVDLAVNPLLRLVFKVPSDADGCFRWWFRHHYARYGQCSNCAQDVFSGYFLRPFHAYSFLPNLIILAFFVVGVVVGVRLGRLSKRIANRPHLGTTGRAKLVV